MSDPQPTTLKKRPTRAEPLQPDRPGQGQEQTDEAAPGSPDESTQSVDRRKEQTEAALKNTREGYD